jgi:hypothetical protein
MLGHKIHLHGVGHWFGIFRAEATHNPAFRQQSVSVQLSPFIPTGGTFAANDPGRDKALDGADKRGSD